MSKNLENLSIKNSIKKNYFNTNLFTRDKLALKKIIKKIYANIDNRKDIFHILSKKFTLDFDKSNLKKFSKYKLVIIIGMGGSVLGTHAIYSFLKKRIKKNFVFLDNLDHLKIEKIKKKFDLKNSLFFIVSKSGNTIETLVNTNLLKDNICSKNTIIITEDKKNLLSLLAKKKKNITNKA